MVGTGETEFCFRDSTRRHESCVRLRVLSPSLIPCPGKILRFWHDFVAYSKPLFLKKTCQSCNEMENHGTST